MSTAYGNFHDFCRDTSGTLPVCNLFNESPTRGGPGYGGCELRGVPVRGDYIRNLGSIIIAFIAILVSLFLIWLANRKRAAVGRREMQIFLLGYIIVEICEIITIGGFPLNGTVRIAFSGIHIAAIVGTIWVLMLNGAVGYQIIDDGTFLSVGLLIISGLVLAIGTGYIALDTGFSWSGYWDADYILNAPNRHYALYTLYQLAPLVFLFIYFLLEALLVIRVLGETRPLFYLIGAVLLFAIGQIFQYVISVHLCNASSGAINGALFETLFTLLAVGAIYGFWSSITEDDWPLTAAGGGAYA